jgi:hypothetical protein
MIRKLSPLLIIILFPIHLIAQIDHWESIILEDDEWKYRVPTTQPDQTWINLSFDDGTWDTGNSGFGYGDNDDNTLLPEGTIAIYIRKTFEIIDLSAIVEATMHLDYDDSFVAYLNGVEITRDLVSGNPPPFDQLADGLHEGSLYQGQIPPAFNVELSLLNQGNNVLAIEVHNQGTNSSDLTAIPFLSVGINNATVNYREVPSWLYKPDITFTESKLPIVVINSDRQEIFNDPKTIATIGIIYNGESQTNSLSDPFNEFEGICGIEIRGESSQSFDKKSYGFEMWDEAGNDIDTGFLDFPAEEDFILYGPYSDKSLINNRLAMKLANELGHYASRTRFVELMLNDDYVGIYILMEKIKRGKNRIDVAKLEETEISGDDLTGGYIFRVDKGSYDGWPSKYPALNDQGGVFYQYYYPNQDEIRPEQKSYISSFVGDFEDAVMSPTYKNNQGKHYTDYINLRSFVDNFIMNEIAKNVDAYRLSTYFYKDKDSKGGKINCGYWDFNLAYGNADYCGGVQTDGWQYYQCDHGGYPLFWDRMLQDTLFTNALKCRWESLRETKLHTDTIFQYIDEFVDELDGAQQRNFDRWQVMGVYLWPNAWFYAQATSHEAVIVQQKNWLSERLTWIDQNLPGQAQYCEIYDNFEEEIIIDPKDTITDPTDTTKTLYYQGSIPDLNIFPNPAHDYLQIVSKSELEQLNITNLSGMIMLKTQPASTTYDADLSSFENGVYFIQVKTNSQSYTQRFIVMK